MPTLNKLEYLDETKEQIKDALNTNFNSGITDEDTFRSYVGKIDDIYTNWAKVTGEGTELTLSNVKKGRMPLQPKGNTEQTTYSGKNLLKISGTKQTINGITFTQNADGSIGVKGTATANATYTSTTLQTIEPSKTYKLSGCPGGGSTSTYRLILRVRSDETTNIVTISDTGSGGNLTTTAEAKYMLGEIIVYSGQTVNLTFYPQLELGSSPTLYEPYVGGTPSPNPDYPQDIRVVTGDNTLNVHGKNLFNPSNVLLNKEIRNNVVAYSSVSNIYYMKVNIGTKYNFSKKSSAKSGIIGFADKIPNAGVTTYDRTVLSGIASISKTATHKYLILQLQQDEDLSETMVEVGNTKTTYQPYQSKAYEINLGSIELCKIGDYKDVIFKNNQLSEYYDSTLDEDSCYIKKEIGKVVLDGNENYYFYSIDDKIMRFQPIYMNGIAIPQTPYYSDKFIYMGKVAEIHEVGITSGSSTTRSSCFIFINKTIANTVEDFKTWLSTHNTEVYYVLATPTYETITDETLISQLEALNNAMSFDGTNYISSEYATGNAPVIISASALMKGGN